VARSRNNFCHEKAKIRFLFIVVGLHVTINDIKVFTVAMEVQKLDPFTLLSSYKIFYNAVNNIKY
jgi:hypothetical protein